MPTTRVATGPLLYRALAALVIPLALWVLIWSTAGFPFGGPPLTRAGAIWAIAYLPAKLASLLIHKHTGLLRDVPFVVSTVAAAFSLVWLIGAAVGLLAHGLLAIPGLVLFAYTLFLVWSRIRGEEP